MKKTVVVNDKTIEFDLADDGHPPIVFMGVRKSGSTIFFKLVQAICKAGGRTPVDVANKFFNQDIPANAWRNLDAVTSILAPGNIYSGFRASPNAFVKSPHWKDAVKVFLVRDPRDALVSQYFSTAFTHSLPSAEVAVAGGIRETLGAKREMAQAMSVEDYVMQNLRGFVNTYRDYNKLLDGHAVQLYRYEDVIFKKREWIHDIAAKIGVQLSGEAVEEILSWADVRPSTEDPKQFVRKVTPGDYKEKISSAGIAQMNKELAPVVRQYGYDLR